MWYNEKYQSDDCPEWNGKAYRPKKTWVCPYCHTENPKYIVRCNCQVFPVFSPDYKPYIINQTTTTPPNTGD
jgi:hypothetical protein